jgi:hypothetical protein
MLKNIKLEYKIKKFLQQMKKIQCKSISVLLFIYIPSNSNQILTSFDYISYNNKK